jgi:hypothetical protein
VDFNAQPGSLQLLFDFDLNRLSIGFQI